MRLTIRIKILIAFAVICSTIFAASFFIVKEFNNLETNSLEVIEKSAPIYHANSKIKQSTIEAHLWLEEIMTGNKEKESFDAVIGLIDDASWYANAILNGGTRDDVIIYPVLDESVRTSISDVIDVLAQFKEIAQLRLESMDHHRGTVDAKAVDEAFKIKYDLLLIEADELERFLIEHIGGLLDTIKKDAKQGRRNIFAAIVVVLLIAVATGILLYKLLRNIRYLIDQVDAGARRAASSAEGLTVNSEEAGMATEHIAFTIEKVAAGSKKQVGSVGKSLEAMNVMSANVQQIAVIAEHVSNTSHVASEKAAEGNSAVQTAVSQIVSISRTVDELAITVKALGERTNEIGKITEVITDIAEQTNVLALNAAIEAARAGNHGSGFAVVAGEVRRLAEQSAHSAQEIAQVITKIQDETSNVVQIMGDATKEVAEGIGVVHTAGESFKEIRRSVNDVANQINEVTTAVRQMSSGTEQVAQSIILIAQVAEETASGSQYVLTSTEEQLASMNEIAISANTLSVMSEQLRMLIGKFNV